MFPLTFCRESLMFSLFLKDEGPCFYFNGCQSRVFVSTVASQGYICIM